jgi:hypothetical protein
LDFEEQSTGARGFQRGRTKQQDEDTFGGSSYEFFSQEKI